MPRWNSAVAHNEYEHDAGAEPRLGFAVMHTKANGRAAFFDRIDPALERLYWIRAPLAGQPNRVVLSDTPENAVRAIIYTDRIVL